MRDEKFLSFVVFILKNLLAKFLILHFGVKLDANYRQLEFLAGAVLKYNVTLIFTFLNQGQYHICQIKTFFLCLGCHKSLSPSPLSKTCLTVRKLPRTNFSVKSRSHNFLLKFLHKKSCVNNKNFVVDETL